MPVTSTIITQTSFKQENTDLPKLSWEENTMRPLIFGPWDAWSSNLLPENIFSIPKKERLTEKMMTILHKSPNLLDHAEISTGFKHTLKYGSFMTERRKHLIWKIFQNWKIGLSITYYSRNTDWKTAKQDHLLHSFQKWFNGSQKTVHQPENCWITPGSKKEMITMFGCQKITWMSLDKSIFKSSQNTKRN